MGKRLIQQRRGRGTGAHRSPSHRFKGEVRHHVQDTVGQVVDLVHCAGHSAPLMQIEYVDGEVGLSFAPRGIKVGDEVTVGSDATVTPGNVVALSEIPEGTLVHNIELRPGDGGKLVRSSGGFARVVAKSEKGVRILLPSKKEKIFSADCRAAVGVLAGGGRPDKPFLKAGIQFKRRKVKNKLYPKVQGISMNAVDHPFGGGKSSQKGRPTQSSRHAPPGRKVGKIAPRRTGKKR